MAGNKKKKTKVRPLIPRPGARYTCFGDGLCCTDIHGIGPLTKKEVAGLNRGKRKITRNLGGIREMSSMPGAMVVIDPSREGNAVREARKMGIPVIGLLDTGERDAVIDKVNKPS